MQPRSTAPCTDDQQVRLGELHGECLRRVGEQVAGRAAPTSGLVERVSHLFQQSRAEWVQVEGVEGLQKRGQDRPARGARIEVLGEFVHGCPSGRGGDR